jgi:uncharacterized damage-inducible protein DinB
VPADQFDYKPHEKSMSLGQLAGHIAETPSWLHAIMEPEMDMAAGAMDGYEPFVPKTHDELMESFQKNLDAVTPALEGRDDAFMEAIWVMRAGDQEFMKSPRVRAVRDILIHHQAHHRGQLTVYLRMLGLAVPATFGDSADEPMMQPS